MRKHHYYFYLCWLFFAFSNVLLAETFSLQATPTNSCTLDVPAEQRNIFLTRCIELAELNNQEAQYQLGLYYSENILTPVNYPEAITWFKRAAAQAHVKAQLQLGYMYFRGEGITANNLQAYIIFKIAGINGSNDAMDAADLVAEQMTPEELQQAATILGKTFRSYIINLPKQQ